MVDVLKDYCAGFISKSKENFALYEFLNEQDKFINWQVVAIFYSALCLAKAYFYSKGVKRNSINSHDAVKYWLACDVYTKRNEVLKYYNVLYAFSREARYSNKNITKTKLQTAIKNYEIVKELLEKDNKINP